MVVTVSKLNVSIRVQKLFVVFVVFYRTLLEGS
jgi:hypothetical protein